VLVAWLMLYSRCVFSSISTYCSSICLPERERVGVELEEDEFDLPESEPACDKDIFIYIFIVYSSTLLTYFFLPPTSRVSRARRCRRRCVG